MAWYSDIEDYIIEKEAWETTSTVIGQFDDYLHKLELRALRHTEKNGLQHAVVGKVVQDMYYTEAGNKRIVDTRLYKQNTAWIYRYIQNQLVRHGTPMSPHEIRAALDSVTLAYYAAEIRGVAITVQLSVSMAHRIKKAA